VVTAEFVLLTGVYERAVPVSRAEVVVAAVDGQLQSASLARATTLAQQAMADYSIARLISAILQQ
jgi:hypothetical protein